LVADRRRREYDSLFASNIVLSRRPDAERPDAARQDRGRLGVTTPVTNSRTAGAPSLDDVAEAVVRATTKAAATPAFAATQSGPASVAGSTERESDARPAGATESISPSGPVQRLLEGTVIDTVLTNRLDGGSAAAVNCMVTNAVYSHSGRDVLIPAGARILGETKPVQSFGETRLAVAFHRLVMPDGSTHTLDRPPALNQTGDAGLRDQVSQHYGSTFGASAAVGLISGLAQFVGTAGYASGGSNRTVIIAGPADASAQASMQMMNRLLNRIPTITIREGHRIKVYLTKDLELPPYSERGAFVKEKS
jgi:type IV secretion system protein VirB10